jgi:Trk K+ transport system NAD-binding subunit
VPEGFEIIFTLASVLLLFQGCDALVSTSGILAVVVAGIVVGNLPTHIDRDLREFNDQLTLLLIGLLFVLLAADVRVADVYALGWRGLLVLGALVFLVRPLNVWVSTLGTGLSRRERNFIIWVAPRGIVAAAIASLTATVMAGTGIAGGAELRALVFLTIAGTVLLAGLTAGPVAGLLGLRLPGRDTVAILGAEGLGLALATELDEAGVPVLFLDFNPQSCRRAQEAGFPVIFGNALEERTLQRARFEVVGVAVGLTSKEAINSLFVGEARERFGVPDGHVALGTMKSTLTPDFVRRREAKVLFDGPHDVDQWDAWWRHGEVQVEKFDFNREAGGADPAEPETRESGVPQELFVILAIRRGERAFPMSLDFELREGDVASVALRAEEREEALGLLARMGWTRQS